MAVRTLLRMGAPRLAEIARPVENLNDPALAELLIDLEDTMAAAEG